MTQAQLAAEELVMGFEFAWNAHDMQAFGALFHPDASFVNRFGMYARGQEAVVELHRTIHATIYRDSRLKAALETVDPVGSDAAVVHMQSVLHVGPAMPHGPRELETRMLLVITRESGAWRIKAGENVAVIDPGPLPELGAAGGPT